MCTQIRSASFLLCTPIRSASSARDPERREQSMDGRLQIVQHINIMDIKSEHTKLLTLSTVLDTQMYLAFHLFIC